MTNDELNRTVVYCKHGHEREIGKHCKACAKLHNKAWRERNRAYHLARVREWNQRNPERARAHRKKHYDKNREARCAASQAWYRQNRAHALLMDKQRRARKLIAILRGTV